MSQSAVRAISSSAHSCSTKSTVCTSAWHVFYIPAHYSSIITHADSSSRSLPFIVCLNVSCAVHPHRTLFITSQHRQSHPFIMAQKFDMRFNLHTEHYSPHGAVGFYSRVAIRFLQFIFGLTVIGLYAVDLDRARKAHVYTDSRWAYAVFVGTFSAVAAMIFAIPRAKFYLLWPLDVLIL